MDRLIRIWNELEGPAAKPTEAPALGYRGCFAIKGEKRWNAFQRIVTLTSPEGSESRRDAGRVFERQILKTAPADIPVADFVDFDPS